MDNVRSWHLVLVALIGGCGGQAAGADAAAMAAGGDGAAHGGGGGGESGATQSPGGAGSSSDAGASGEPVGPVAPLRDRFSVGPDFVCAVSSAGILGCWGPGAGGLVDELGADDNRAVSVGAQYSCVVKRNGTPVCTGYLGRFSTAPLVRLDVGSGSFCGIEAEGGAVACRGSETSQVPDGLIATDISVAGVFACAVGTHADLP